MSSIFSALFGNNSSNNSTMLEEGYNTPRHDRRKNGDPRRIQGEGTPTPIRNTADGKKWSSDPDRLQRLKSGMKKELYHATTSSAAQQIKDAGVLRRGKVGIAGSGIYFAESDSMARHKCRI